MNLWVVILAIISICILLIDTIILWLLLRTNKQKLQKLDILLTMTDLRNKIFDDDRKSSISVKQRGGDFKHSKKNSSKCSIKENLSKHLADHPKMDKHNLKKEDDNITEKENLDIANKAIEAITENESIVNSFSDAEQNILDK